jgi:hypothetical protein
VQGLACPVIIACSGGGSSAGASLPLVLGAACARRHHRRGRRRRAGDDDRTPGGGQRGTRLLGQGLGAIPGLRLVPPQVDSNMVFLTLDGVKPLELAGRLSQAKVLCLDEGGRVRMVTHYGIERADVEEALERIRATVGALA